MNQLPNPPRMTNQVKGSRRSRSASPRQILFALVLSFSAFFVFGFTHIAQALALQADSPIKVGEKLTYSISFNNYDSVAYADIHVVSRGKLEGRDALELSGKLRSVDLLSAAFYTWDEARTTFISPESGYPLLVKDVTNVGPFPRENIRNYIGQPSTAFDLLSMIYRVRSLGGAGSFSVLEDDQIHNFTFVISGTEQVSTQVGNFETQVSTVESSYFAEFGIKKFKVNFTTDSRTMPVMVRFETDKGVFEARLAGIQDLAPKPDPTPTATPVPTPIPVITPTPVPTPLPYVDNQPLSTDLPFVLGEKLDYSVTRSGVPSAKVSLVAAERKQFQGIDSLKLVAQVTETFPANELFGSADRIETWVDPETLVPAAATLGFTGAFSQFSQQTLFDQIQGTATGQAGQPIPIPIGTHNVLSLAYAVRAFNLRPGIDSANPSNDTRVALFAGNEAYVLTLRPSQREEIEVGGRKYKANLITVRTGEGAADALNIKIWLSADGRRLPLRLEAGPYRADLERVGSVSVPLVR